jgi:glycosyltransferase involved in cell wall biosynthesis
MKKGLRSKITIAIPTYNSQEYVIDTIESVLHQTISVNKIVIFDNCSTDNTILRIKSLFNSVSDQIIFEINVNSENIGYQNNWNQCFGINETDFLIILHSDDILKPTAVEKLLNSYNSFPEVAIIGARENHIDSANHLVKTSKNTINAYYRCGEIFEFVNNENMYITCSSVMFNMNKLGTDYKFDSNIKGADEVFWVNVLKDFPIYILGEVLVGRRIHQEQTENRDFLHNSKDIVRSSKSFYKIVEFENRKRYKKKLLVKLKRKNAINGIKLAKVSLKNGYYKLVIYYFVYSIQQYPLIMFSISGFSLYKKIIGKFFGKY